MRIPEKLQRALNDESEKCQRTKFMSLHIASLAEEYSAEELTLK
jgi:hypothetical protein